MRAACRGLPAPLAAVLVLPFLSVAGAAPSVLQTLALSEGPEGLDVAPNGNALAFVTDRGLRVHALLPDGQAEATGKSVALQGLVVVAFSPSGQQIVCADRRGRIHIVRRTDWQFTTVYAPAGNTGPVAIDVVGQPPEAYVQYYDTGDTVVVDVSQAKVISTVPASLGAAWKGRGLALTLDGGFLGQMAKNSAEDAVVKLRVHDNRAPGRPLLGTFDFGDDARACCPGPDPQQVMVVSKVEPKLSVLRLGPQVVLEGTQRLSQQYPIAIASSPTGPFTVVADHDGRKLSVLPTRGLRDMAASGGSSGQKPVPAADVAVPGPPWALALHPTLPVAYVALLDPPAIVAVALGAPGA